MKIINIPDDQITDLQFSSKIIDSLPYGVIAINTDGYVREINFSAIELCGLGTAPFKGKSIVELADRSTLDWGDLGDAIRQARKYSEIIVSPRGKRILSSVKRIHGESNESHGTLVTLHDLELLQHAQRAASGSVQAASFKNYSSQKVRPDFAQQRILSPSLDQLISRGERALLQGARILITGESGVGKTELSRYFHYFAADSVDPFVVVNCASIPDSLFESELFGYEKGAFTGALQSGKTGFIEKANGGTLFLDEVGEIPLHSQGKLLHFLEEGTVQKVGAANPKKTNVRIIAATNQNLAEMVTEKTFRKDLFYRLAVIELKLEPLRNSSVLLDHLIDQFVQKVNLRRPKPLIIPKPCRQRLFNYSFPGNIRELYNIIQQLSVFADDSSSMINMIDELLTSPTDSQVGDHHSIDVPIEKTLKDVVRAYERNVIEATITQLGSKRKAALHLGVDIGTIVRKTKPNSSQYSSD